MTMLVYGAMFDVLLIMLDQYWYTVFPPKKIVLSY